MAQTNTEQREAVDTILRAVDDYAQASPPSQGHYFLTYAPGETGGCAFAWNITHDC